MHKRLATLTLLALMPVATAQEVPGLRSSLTAQAFVPINDTVQLRLSLQIEADTEIPSELLTGYKLQVKVGDQPSTTIEQAGKGGMIAVAAGTRIDRLLTFPAARFVTTPELSQLAVVTVGWQGLAGTNCMFRVAPDTRNVDVATLNLAATQVVLVTNYGEMRLSFRPDKAPKTVANFVKLCLSGFYDGTKFHRVHRDFMIQGGCPLTKDDSKRELWGTGGPGYSIDAEVSDLRHLRGTLSMARYDDPNSAGSGFFIMHQDTPGLDRKYTAFGNLEEGADTLDRIANVPCTGPKGESPIQPVILRAAIVLPVKK